MPEPEVTPTPTPQPATPTPPSPAPPPDAVDEHGVPWKNRVAEAQRKLQEQIDLNTQYQQALGRFQQTAQPQTTPTQGKYTYELNGEKYELDAPTAKIVEKIAEEVANRTAHSFVGRAQMQQEASDPEILNEARTIYQNEVLQSPFMAQWNDDARQGWAIKEAQVRVLNRKSQAASQQSSSQALQAAASAQAQAASLPSTQAGGSSNTDKETYIRNFIADPASRAYLKSMHELDPDSPEGQEKLKVVAEYAWKGSPVSERFAQTVELLKRSQ